MIVPSYRIAASTIPGAGRGLYLAAPVTRASVLIAPDAIDRTWRLTDILGDPALAAQMHAGARWFEDRYTLSPEWPDECFVNHSFQPTGLWHLGFVFATADLPEGSEITVDYRHLLPPGEAEDFVDADSGETIIGFSWRESLSASTRALAALLEQTDD
jgi:hypothetical protein